VLILIVHAWANDTLDKNGLRIMTLNFAQGIMIFQLTVTFTLQIAIVNFELTAFQSSMVWDMFGFFLHNLKLYQVIFHLLSLSLSIQAIQLFRTTRNSYLQTQALIMAEPAVPNVLGGGNVGDPAEKKSEKILMTQRRFGRTLGSGGFKSSAKASLALDRVREKTMELRMRRADESSFFQVAQ
jgi:hypothetical protein